MEEDSNTSGGATIINNIDFTDINEQLKKIAESLSPTNKAIIRDCAITLYTNTNFEVSKNVPIQIAKQCIANALILAKELQNQNLLD